MTEHWRFRVRRIGTSDNAPNEWVSTGEAYEFKHYGTAAMKALKESMWYADQIVMIEDVNLYPIAAYVNGYNSYCWNQAPPEREMM